MDTTVGIVTYHRPEHVDRLLDHVPSQRSSPDEVIVLNSGGNTETESIVASHGDRFEKESITLRHHAKVDDTSLQAGRNAVIELSNGDVVCFVDDDVVPGERWLEGIERGYEWDESVAAVGGPALITDEALTVQYDILDSPSNQNHLNQFGEHEQQTYRWVPPAPVETDFLVGANMSFRADVLEEIGGFDPLYEGQPEFEETDVMVRLWKRGETIVYHPEALVYHRNVSQERDERVSYWYARNSVRFRRKNFPETYPRSLARLLLDPEYGTPGWRLLKRAIFGNDRTSQWRLRGYVDELLLDRFDGGLAGALKAPYADE